MKHIKTFNQLNEAEIKLTDERKIPVDDVKFIGADYDVKKFPDSVKFGETITVIIPQLNLFNIKKDEVKRMIKKSNNHLALKQIKILSVNGNEAIVQVDWPSKGPWG